MVKTLNVLFIILIVLGCSKDKVEPSPFIDEAFSFLAGTWKWEYSVIDRNGRLDFVKANSVSKFCEITFLTDGKIKIISNNIDVTYSIRTKMLANNGDDKFFRFDMDGNKVITFSYTKENGLLNSSFPFFSFEPLQCNENPTILDNGFKKM